MFADIESNWFLDNNCMLYVGLCVSDKKIQAINYINAIFFCACVKPSSCMNFDEWNNIVKQWTNSGNIICRKIIINIFLCLNCLYFIAEFAAERGYDLIYESVENRTNKPILYFPWLKIKFYVYFYCVYVFALLWLILVQYANGRIVREWHIFGKQMQLTGMVWFQYNLHKLILSFLFIWVFHILS